MTVRPPSARGSRPYSRRALLGSGLAVALCATALVSAPAFAKDVRAELDVDLTQLTVGQTVSARLRVINGVVHGRPQLPVGAGLSARYTGQSQQQSIVNFESTRIVEFSYALTALAAGDWTVGPVGVQVGRATLTARAVTVRVGARSDAEPSQNDVTASLSDSHPYLGQVVVYRFRHQHADRVLNLDWTPPAFDGFVAEKTAEADQQDYKVQQDGQTLQVEEIYVPLVATALGQRTIPPAILTAQVPGRSRSRQRNPFMSNVETRTLSSESLPARVRPLPKEGRPSSFSGLVGRFTLSAAVSLPGQTAVAPAAAPITVAMGESLTLEITVRGDGTLAGAELPAPVASDAYRVYDDAPEVAGRVVDGHFLGQAVFRRAVVPTQEGDITVAPVELTVFDPVAGHYVVLKTQPVVLHVTPGEAGQGVVSQFGAADQAQSDQRAKVQSVGEDILPVPGGAHVRNRGLAASLRWALGLPAVPLLGLLAVTLQRGLAARKPDPRALLRATLRVLPTDASARLAALESSFRDACALRLDCLAPGLDRAAVETLGPDAAAIYDAIGRARYGGFEPGGDLESRIRAFVEAT